MAQVIVISSLNAQSGKTLLSAHLSIMLCKDYKTALFDSAAEQSPLAAFIAARYHLNLSKNYNLFVPTYHSLSKTELTNNLSHFDAIILDAPDSKFFPEADVLITPVKGKNGLDALNGAKAPFAALVWDAKKRRAAMGKNAFRWVVVPNDDFSSVEEQQLKKTGRFAGFEVAPRLSRRAEFETGLKTGVTVMDKDIKGLESLFKMPDLYARRNLKKLTDFIWQNK